MAEDKWQHQSIKFGSRGLDLTNPLDQVPDDAYPYFSNATSIFEGSLTTRPGLYKIINEQLGGYVHSLKTYYDVIFAGAGNSIYTGMEGGSWTAIPPLDPVSDEGWTGDGSPISFVGWTGINGNPMMLATDGSQMRGIKLYGESYALGIRKPGLDLNAFPNSATAYPDAAGQLNTQDLFPYQYRYTYYSSSELIESNPNAGEGDEIDVVAPNNAVLLTIQNSPLDPVRVDSIRLYRRGGTLFDYHLVGQFQVSGAVTTIHDIYSDDYVSTNPILSEDNDQPFTSFNRDTNEVVYAQPVDVLFGPYLGKYVFGVGDPLQPGNLYWTNPWNPDAASAYNYLTVTSDADPLLNGFIFQGKAYVITRNTIHAIYPSTTGGSTFVTVETGAGAGIFFKYALAVGPKVWFVGRNGIYEFDGGAATCITEQSGIKPLFHGYDLYHFSINQGYAPLDYYFADEKEVRLAWADPYLYFMYPNPAYLDPNTTPVVMRYHYPTQRWESWDISTGMGEELCVAAVHDKNYETLFGTRNGWVYGGVGFTDGGTTAWNGTPIPVRILTSFFDQDLSREEKIYGDAVVEYEDNGFPITVTPYINEALVPLPSVVLPTSGIGAGRQRQIIPIVPTGGSEGILAKSIAFDFQWTSDDVGPQLHELDVSFLPRPDIRRLRETDWTDAGYPLPKYVRGLVIECDTLGADKTIIVQADGVTQVTKVITAVAGVIANQAARRVYQLSWPVFRGINLRIITTDTDPWMIYKMEWIYEKEPECFKDWDTNWLDLDWPYEKYIKGVSIEADTQGTDKTIQLFINGDDATVVDSFTINHDGRTITMMKFNNVLARTIKLVSPDAGTCGYLYKVDWIWDREPPCLTRWETQENALHSNAYIYLRELYVGLRSTDVVCLDIWTDQGNGQFNTQLPRIFIASTRGERQKPKVELPAVKGKNFKFLFTSQECFKIYNSDTEVRLKEWNQDLGWKVYQLPFLGGQENP